MKKLNIIILSKNRALQCQALIESLFLNLKSYYPVSFKIVYNDEDKEHFFNPNSYRKLKSLYSYITFESTSFDGNFDINNFLIPDELNLILTDNTIFTLPFDLDELNYIDFDNSVLDLFKGINRQLNENSTYRYDAHKWKKEDNLYVIEPNSDAFELFSGIVPNIGKIFKHQSKDLNSLKHYFYPLAPCFVNNINSETKVDNYEAENLKDYASYALCLRFLMGENIDVNKIQNYSPNKTTTEYRFKFVDNVKATNPFDYFKNIVYMNLDNREDRKNQVESELEKFNIKAQRFSSYKASVKDAMPYIEGRNLDQHSIDLAPSRVAATKSHLGVIQMAKDNNWDNVLVLEDDVKFLDHADIILTQALKELENLPEWDILYLGANSMDTIKQISGHVGQMTAAFCGHAYVVNKHFYDTLLSYDWNEYLIIDQWLLNICRDPRFKAYTVLPIIAIQYSSFSDIEGKSVNYENVLIDSYTNTLNKIK
jgi:glycosyl transferase family 25